jgi:hypothetical protein
MPMYRKQPSGHLGHRDQKFNLTSYDDVKNGLHEAVSTVLQTGIMFNVRTVS